MYRVRVYYGDTDSGGVVYYGNYLRFFEAARTEFLLERGFDLKAWTDRDVVFVVTTAEVAYLAPAKYGDVLIIDTCCTALSGATFQMACRVRREGDNRPISEGSTRLACIGQGGRPVRIPSELRALLQASLEKGW
ncbi:MAG: YbgC/FadM family acyl-CoA thioesterase [bacterium]|nr:YbgC/FadM family acyl-CoA thioesterase [bacterium]